jgi:hypothetical protein
MEASEPGEKMRRSTIAFLVAFLLTIGAGSVVVAQSPSSSPTAPEPRAEINGVGFGVTFPEGWLVETRGGESQAVSADGSALCQPNAERSDEPIDDPAAFLDKVAAMVPNFSDGEPMPVIETSEIELPAGRAVRFIADYALDDDLVEGYDARYATTYILTDSHTLLFLGCWAPERPDDDWLSIAESIEFLPEEQSETGGDSGGRVEVVESRIALTFPDDWTVEAMLVAGSASTSFLDPKMSDLLTTVISAVPPTMHDRCVVVDLAALVHAEPDWVALDDVVDGFRLALGADPRWVGLKSTYLELSAGRTGRIQRALDGEAESVSTYFFTQDDAWFFLECVSHTVPPEDGRSIAETFEFLAE